MKQITLVLADREVEFLSSLPRKKDDGRVTTGYSIAIHKLIYRAMAEQAARAALERLEEARV